MLKSRSFKGIGCEVRGLPFEAKLNPGQYLDEVLGYISGPFTVVDGEGQTYFGIEPRFPWDDAGDGESEMPKTRVEAVNMIAKALATVMRDADGGKLSPDELTPYIEDIDEAWVENW